MLVETLSAGLAPSVEASVAEPLLKAPAPAISELLHLSYQCAFWHATLRGEGFSPEYPNGEASLDDSAVGVFRDVSH